MSKARILIVEDEAIIASVIAGALRKFGYDVIDILSTGESAVTAALQKLPDLILMDIRLQGDMDGISAAERIQEQADIPIIYLTAYADEPTLDRAKRTQPYGYIPKPFQEIELKTTIEMALYKHGFEIQIKASEAKFRSLFENSQDVIYIVDQQDRLQEMNPAGVNLFGYAREEIIGRKPDQLYADPRERKAFVTELRDKKSLKDHEIRLRNKGGEILFGLVTANVMIDKAGGANGIQGIIRDVTEKRKREETLLLLQTAIDSSSEAVLITDRESKIVYGNPAVETMTGYSPPEIIGRDVRFLGSGVPQDEKAKTMWDAIMNGASWGGEFLNRHKDGTIYFQRAIISPVRDREGGDQPFRQHRLRHHQGEKARGTDDPGGQDGFAGAPGQRHRPRLQQLPDHHQRLFRNAALRKREQQEQRAPGRHPASREERLQAGGQNPGLQPPPGDGPGRHRHQRRHEGPGTHGTPPAGRRDRAETRPACRLRPGADRSHPDRAGADQPRAQCPRRHAVAGKPDPRHLTAVGR